MSNTISSKFQHYAPMLILAFAMLGSFPCPVNAQTPNATRSKPQHKPNIIFIMADDLGYGDIGCFGQKKIKRRVFELMTSGTV